MDNIAKTSDSNLNRLRIQSPLAKLYSTSVMEQHHFNQCIMILHNNVSESNVCNLKHRFMFWTSIQGKQYSYQLIIERIFDCNGDHWKVHFSDWSLIAFVVSGSSIFEQAKCPKFLWVLKFKIGKSVYLRKKSKVQKGVDLRQLKKKNCLCKLISARTNLVYVLIVIRNVGIFRKI